MCVYVLYMCVAGVWAGVGHVYVHVCEGGVVINYCIRAFHRTHVDCMHWEGEEGKGRRV